MDVLIIGPSAHIDAIVQTFIGRIFHFALYSIGAVTVSSFKITLYFYPGTDEMLCSVKSHLNGHRLTMYPVNKQGIFSLQKMSCELI